MGSVNGKPDKCLTYKQSAFCHGIVQGLSQTEAYRVGFPGTKMSTKTMKEAASRLMQNSNVIATIEELKAPVVAKVRYDFEEWLNELQAVAFFDPRKLFDDSGKPLDVSDIPEDVAPAIAGFEANEIKVGTGDDAKVLGTTRKYKLANKLQALQLFGRATGYLQDKVVTPTSELEQTSTEMLLAMRDELLARKAALGKQKSLRAPLPGSLEPQGHYWKAPPPQR